MALATAGCDETASLTSGSISVVILVSGTEPTGTWLVEVEHENGESASRRVGPNRSTTFNNLQTTGEWTVRVLNDGQLGGFDCSPPGGTWTYTNIHDETRTYAPSCHATIIARAGSDEYVDVGDAVILDGSASTVGPGGQIEWQVASAPSRSTAQIGNATSLVPDPFVVDEPGTYTLRLVLTVPELTVDDELVVRTNRPDVTDATPLSGSEGTIVTITGTNFSPSLDGNTVEFGGVMAPILSAGATQLEVEVPTGAASGVIWVRVDETGHWSTGPYFTVLSPADPWTFVMPQSESDDYQTVSFADALTGMTVGNDYRVLRSTDGGASWTALTPIDAGYGRPRVVSVPSPSVAYVAAVFSASTSNVLKTTDGGANWTVVRSEMDERIEAVAFVDDSEGWAVGNGGAVIHTVDGGATWTSQTSGTASLLRNVYFVDDQLGFAWGFDGTLRRTTDGGDTDWQPVTPPDAFQIQDLWFRDSSNGMLIARLNGGAPGVFTSADGGASWTPLAHDLPASFLANGVAMPTADVATIVGQVSNSARGIYRSEDGGLTWTLDAGTNPRLGRDVHMFDADTGVAVGLAMIMWRH